EQLQNRTSTFKGLILILLWLGKPGRPRPGLSFVPRWKTSIISARVAPSRDVAGANLSQRRNYREKTSSAGRSPASQQQASSWLPFGNTRQMRLSELYRAALRN